jgi:hypothetical protein
MPSNAFTVLSTLAFLGTLGLVLLALVVGLWGKTHANRSLSRRGLQAAAGLSVGYLAVLVLVGAASREQVLPVGSEKYFCELDCHLAYRVEQVTPIRKAAGGGTTWAVRIRTRFDERTISPHRSREAPLRPNPRKLELIDVNGRRYAEADTLEPMIVADSSTPLTRELKPGESYATTLLFVLPAGAVPAKLSLTEDLLVNRFIIGNEESLFHREVMLALPA